MRGESVTDLGVSPGPSGAAGSVPVLSKRPVLSGRGPAELRSNTSVRNDARMRRHGNAPPVRAATRGPEAAHGDEFQLSLSCLSIAAFGARRDERGISARLLLDGDCADIAHRLHLSGLVGAEVLAAGSHHARYRRRRPAGAAGSQRTVSLVRRELLGGSLFVQRRSGRSHSAPEHDELAALSWPDPAGTVRQFNTFLACREDRAWKAIGTSYSTVFFVVCVAGSLVYVRVLFSEASCEGRAGGRRSILKRVDAGRAGPDVRSPHHTPGISLQRTLWEYSL